MREKKRYIALHIMGNASRETLITAMEHAIMDFLGTKGAAEAGVRILADTYTGRGIVLRCNHRQVHGVKAALALMDHPVLKTCRVSGIIAKAKTCIGG